MLLTMLDFTPHFLIVISFLMLVPVGLVLLYAGGFIYRARQVRGLGGGAAKADSAWVAVGFACTVLLAAAPEVGHRLWLDNQLSRLQAGGDPKVWVQSLTTIKASPLCSSDCSFRYGDLSFDISCPDRVCRRLATIVSITSPTPFTVNPWITIPALYQDVLWTYFGESVVQRCGRHTSSGV